MKQEYDFSKAVRGKFFRKGVQLYLPIYVDGSTRKRLERLAKRTGKPVAELVNQILKKDIELLETLS
jgi:predicted DNA-binding protein